ncbi:ATP-dependent nuclease [Nesterenkonia sphaerica]|uniref:ATP-dependent endonuclease n=1 Tax=Nesterenkonia sphaerica TaxID=1804988 RepID=A0A5R8ZZR3_9MICC|nr:AAA family ATPase [Nesterenkonia sphaerica]TLP71919.1 ATP-dependent endonuclease [Nesterenkonia sphaerica]
MITKLKVRGYRTFRDIEFRPNPGMNILVGENGSGKSTLLEAINLVLTGRINGRPASEELNPYWFNQSDVAEFFQARQDGFRPEPPTIDIEVFLDDRDEFSKHLRGGHSSERPVVERTGLRMLIEPDPDYAEELEAHLASDTAIVPVEYYKVDWHTFGRKVLNVKPRELSTALIDSRTVRSSNGVDYHLKHLLNTHLTPESKSRISVAFRSIKEQMTREHLSEVNSKLSGLTDGLDGNVSLAMDQSARSSWDSSVVPHVDDVPFAMAGLGEQAAIKIALAMGRQDATTQVVMVEEPENHLSHTNLNVLIRQIEEFAGDGQQLFVTTHSSYVLNRLGLDQLQLVSACGLRSFNELDAQTVRYFQKLPGYDTLRMVLADKFVLVEGPSDEILFDRFYKDETGKRPIEDGIDVFSMRGLSLRRCLGVAALLGKKCAVLTDNDGKEPGEITSGLSGLLADGKRQVFIGDLEGGHTLEPQVSAANAGNEEQLKEALHLGARATLEVWMRNNKTEAALRIAESGSTLTAPDYFSRAIRFIRD